MSRDQHDKLSGLTVALHWVVGLGIIGLLCVGFYMVQNEVRELYPIHKAIGTLLFLLILGRVVWRLMNGLPRPVRSLQPWESLASRIVHTVLLVAMVLMPVSGLMSTIGGGYPLDIFGLSLFGPNVVPGEGIVKRSEWMYAAGGFLHFWTAWTIVVCLALHIPAALKHHFVDKDGTLKRMLGQRVSLD